MYLFVGVCTTPVNPLSRTSSALLHKRPAALEPYALQKKLKLIDIIRTRKHCFPAFWAKDSARPPTKSFSFSYFLVLFLVSQI